MGWWENFSEGNVWKETWGKLESELCGSLNVGEKTRADRSVVDTFEDLE